MTSLSHLDSDVAEAALEGPITRARFLQQDRQFVSWIAGDELLELALDIALRDPFDPCHLLVLAPPKAGIGRVLMEAEQRARAPGQRRHAVSMTTPVTFTEARSTRALAAALEAPGTWRASLDRQTTRVVGALEDLQVRLLIVKRLHNLPERHRRHFLAHLDELAEAGQLRLLMTTLRSYRKVLDLRPELKTSTRVVEIGPLPQNAEAIGFVRRVLRRLPLRHETPVTPELMDLLFLRTGGYVGRLVGLLKAAAKEAIGAEEHLAGPPLLRARATLPPPNEEAGG